MTTFNQQADSHNYSNVSSYALRVATAGFGAIGLVLMLHAIDVVSINHDDWLALASTGGPTGWHGTLATIAKYGWSIFIFLVSLWMLQAIRIADRLDTKNFRHSPISAFWVWLTPLYNFYRPYELLRDIHNINNGIVGSQLGPPSAQIRIAQWVFIVSSVIDLMLPLDGLLVAMNPPPEMMTAIEGGDVSGVEVAIKTHVAAGQFLPAKIYAVADVMAYFAFGILLLQVLAGITDGQQRAQHTKARTAFAARTA